MHDVRKQVDGSSSDNCDINKPEGVDIQGWYGFVNNIWMRTMAAQLYATGTTVVSIIITIRIITMAGVAVGIVVIMLFRHDLFKIYYLIDRGLVTRLCVNWRHHYWLKYRKTSNSRTFVGNEIIDNSVCWWLGAYLLLANYIFILN